MPAPANPAPVSGPGRLSRRTDGGTVQKLRDLPDAQYGEAATFRQLQQGAPLAQTPQQPAPSPQSAAPQQGPAVEPVPFSAPTQRPDEPVTAGADAGAGPGMGSLGLTHPQTSTYLTARDVLSQLTAAEPQNSEVAALLNRVRAKGL